MVVTRVLRRLTALAVAMVVLWMGVRGRADVPSVIRYQGRVSVAGFPFTGTGQFKFALVRGDTGATTWSHDGTSVDGLPPASSVSLPTSSGLYSVDLGDTNIANMSLAIPLSALSAPSVGLRIWFNDGAHGLQKLSPDVRLASVPYSMVAASVPDGSITAAQLGAGTVSGSVIGCNVGAGEAEVFIQGMNVYCGVGAGTPTGGFAFTLLHVPAGSHTLKARLPTGMVLSQPITVSQGGTVSGVTFNFGCGTCGDGVVQTDRGEACDDGNAMGGDGCSATCQVEVASCGNGIRQAGEECDDGNTLPGDGCSATCRVEAIGEVEVNDSVATANTGFVVSAASPVRVISGAIGVVGDQDYFQLTVVGALVLHIEVFDGTGTNCAGGMATRLRLLDSAGTEITSDDDSGINGCSALTYMVAGGTYLLHVQENGNNATIPGYILKVTSLAAVGAESEPNNQMSAADPVAGYESYIAGDHSLTFDEDWFRVTLYAAGSLRVETIEGGGLETCDDNTIDSQLEVYDSAGLLLARDDDAGRGYCSLLDGTGSTAAAPALHNLPAGVYYVRVSASPSADADGSQFIYRLAVTVR